MRRGKDITSPADRDRPKGPGSSPCRAAASEAPLDIFPADQEGSVLFKSVIPPLTGRSTRGWQIAHGETAGLRFLEPEDKPYPSKLVLGERGGRPLHVVVAENATDNERIVITVYEPDQDQWESGFRRRKG